MTRPELNSVVKERVQDGHAYVNHILQSELIDHKIPNGDRREFGVGAGWLNNKKRVSTISGLDTGWVWMLKLP